MAFRVPEREWELFSELAEASERNAQSVLRDFISACLQAKSVGVRPVRREIDGSDLSDELELSDDLRRLKGYMEHGNYASARDFFQEVTLQLHGITNPVLLQEARELSSAYLKWIDANDHKTGRYEPDED